MKIRLYLLFILCPYLLFAQDTQFVFCGSGNFYSNEKPHPTYTYDTYQNYELFEFDTNFSYGKQGMSLFVKRDINHVGCNENDYEMIVDENFNSDLESTVFEVIGSNTYPYNFYTPSNGPYMAQVWNEELVIIEDGKAKLKTVRESYYPLDLGIGDPWALYQCGRLISKDVWPNEIWAIQAYGCYKFGKFSARIKIPESTKGVLAYWMFGAGNELDAFEFFDGTERDFTATIHQWNIDKDDPFNINHNPQNNPHPSFALDYDFGKISDEFHTWTMEWTPYKVVFYFDEKPYYEFYKYYKITNDDGNDLCMVGLDCNEIEIGEDIEVWEHIGWDALATRPMDLLITPGILKCDRLPDHKPGNPFKDGCDNFRELTYEIDWVKIEQRPNMRMKIDNENACIGEEITIEILNNYDEPISWNLSPNLEIISQDGNSLTIKGISNGVGIIEASGLDNSTILYGTNNEFEEGLDQDNSYNCHFSDMSVSKIIQIGSPSPEIQYNFDCATKIFDFWIVNDYPDDVTYNWTSSTSGFSIIGTGNSMTAIPISPSTLNDFIFSYQLEITNNCGTTTVTDFLLPECDDEFEPLILYPNPVNEVLQFQFNLEEVPDNINTSFISSEGIPFIITKTNTGKVMHNGKFDDTIKIINTSNWEQGNYQIIYEFNNSALSKSFNVVHQ